MKNMSSAFEASLSLGFKTANEQDYSLNKEDLVIKKYAGITIYQPTLDNIETYVRKYTLNELSSCPSTLNLSIQINPQELDKANNEYVSEATGMVTVKFAGKNIELPFLIMDGELVPFDVIQIEGQRVPYSRENIAKIFAGLRKLEEKEKAGGDESPYVGLEDRVNPSTAPGFLGSVLQIRDQNIAAKQGNGGNYIFAAENMVDILEKVATMKELTKEDLKALEAEFQKKASEELREELEKVASQEDDDTARKLFENVSKMNFEQAYSMPNGTEIAFPERIDNEIRLSYGIVLDKFVDFDSNKSGKVKLVVSTDGRIKILSQSEKFLCFKAKDIRFDFVRKELDTVEDGDVILAFDGNLTIFPSRVCEVSERTFGSGERKNDVTFRIPRISPLSPEDEMGLALTSSEVNNLFTQRISVPLCPLANTKFHEMPYADFVKKKCEETGMSEIEITNLFTRYNACITTNKELSTGTLKRNLKVMATDPATKVIKVTGVIRSYARDKAELEKLSHVEDGEDALEKIAQVEKNKIKVSLKDKDLGAYDVEINYVDESKAVFKRFVKSYNRISKADLRQLLLVIGYNNTEAQEIIFKANNGPFITYALPANANIQALEGAKVQSLAAQKMGNTLKGMINPKDLASALSASIIGNILADTLTASSPKVQEVANGLSRFASEARALSTAFEKIALEKESDTAYDTAVMMNLSARFMDKVASTVTETAIYPRIYEVAKEIMENRSALEKTAYDLVQCKAIQYKNRDEITSPHVLQSAVAQLDALHKVAYTVCSMRYDINEVMEKQATVDFSKFTPKRLSKIVDRVSKKTGLAPKTILGITGTFGAGTAGAAIAAHKMAEKTAGALGGAAIGGLVMGGNKYQQAIDEAKNSDPTATPSDYNKHALPKAAAGVALGAGVGALGGAAVKGIKKAVTGGTV